MEQLKNNPFAEQIEEIIKKHEAAQDRTAAEQELEALAKENGITVNELFGGVLPQSESGELSEEQLEDVSGGGFPFALCLFDIAANSEKPKSLDGLIITHDWEEGIRYIRKCPGHDADCCNWLMCRCHGTRHCYRGWHSCDEYGNSPPFHGFRS